MTRHILFILTGLALFSGACEGPEYSPLSVYQDQWEGQIVFTNQPPQDFSVAVLASMLDERHSVEVGQLYKWMFAEVDGGNGVKLAGRAQAGHFDWRTAGKLRAEPEREFLRIEVLSYLADSPPDSMYPQNFASWTTRIGIPDTLFEMNGERVGDTVSGTIVKLPRSSRLEQIGTFSITKRRTIDAVRPDDATVMTASFSYKTVDDEAAKSRHWQIRAR